MAKELNGHVISTSGGNLKSCPDCGRGPEAWEIRDYDPFFHDGWIYCQCGQYMMRYDAG